MANSNFDNTNTVALWRNESDNESAPVLKGKINVDGVDYEIALWAVQSDNENAPKLRGKVSKPFAKGGSTSSPKKQQRKSFEDF